MKQDLDISNIESKPTVVLVSNQSEFDQLMQHLEGEGCIWQVIGDRPTQHQVVELDFPYCIHIEGKDLSWSTANRLGTPFPEYAAKHIKPTAKEIRSELIRQLHPEAKRRERVEKHKYDAVVFELKMAQTALDNRNKDIDGWVKQNNELRAERDRLKAENVELRKDNGIWRKAGRETEEQKNCALAIIEKQKKEILQSDNSWEAIITAYNALSKEVDDAKDERDRLQADLDMLQNRNNEQGKLVDYLKEELRKSDQLLESKAAEHAHLDTLARKLRDQRDTARFAAALLFILSAGFAVAVLIGRLIPVY